MTGYKVKLLYITTQLRLYGHVGRLPAEDPAHRILSCRDSRGWTMRGAFTRFMVDGWKGLEGAALKEEDGRRI